MKPRCPETFEFLNSSKYSQPDLANRLEPLNR